MIPRANTEMRYGAAAMAFHWLMAVLLITLVMLGLYMVGLPDAGFDTKRVVGVYSIFRAAR